MRLFPGLENHSNKEQVRLSRWLTIFWGVVATGFALQMIGGSETVLELVNKIGSAFYGPILATFWLGMLTKKGNQTGAISGLLFGVGVNIILWQFFGPTVSWLWWNVFGFLTSFGFGYFLSRLGGTAEISTDSIYLLDYNNLQKYIGEKKYYFILAMVFVLILIFSFLIQYVFLSA